MTLPVGRCELLYLDVCPYDPTKVLLLIRQSMSDLFISEIPRGELSDDLQDLLERRASGESILKSALSAQLDERYCSNLLPLEAWISEHESQPLPPELVTKYRACRQLVAP
jgi:hypothetical protein